MKDKTAKSSVIDVKRFFLSISVSKGTVDAKNATSMFVRHVGHLIQHHNEQKCDQDLIFFSNKTS